MASPVIFSRNSIHYTYKTWFFTRGDVTADMNIFRYQWYFNYITFFYIATRLEILNIISMRKMIIYCFYINIFFIFNFI